MGDEWYTPKELFERMDIVFDLDVAAPKGGALVPAHKYYTMEDDGLAQDWFGLVWCNPPYSKPSPWVDKWLSHGNGLALLPMAKSKWFNKMIDSNANFSVLPSTFKFVSPNGKPLSLMMGSSLWAMGEGIEVLKRLEMRIR